MQAALKKSELTADKVDRANTSVLVDRTVTRNDRLDTTPVRGKPVDERGLGVKKLSEGAHVVCIPRRFKEWSYGRRVRSSIHLAFSVIANVHDPTDVRQPPVAAVCGSIALLNACDDESAVAAVFSWASASIEAACRAIFSIPLSAQHIQVRPWGVTPASPRSNLVPAAENDP